MPAEKMDDSEPAHSTDLAQAPAPEPVDDGSPHVEVDVVHEVDQWRDNGVDRSLVARAVKAAIAAAGSAGDDPCEIAVLLTSDAQVRDLNGKWRGQERPTNVLSFPLAADGAPPGEPRLLGDVVLAFETVLDEAGAKGLPLGDHASHLVVHGVLHLLGFDHQSDAEADGMEELERRVMASLGLADPYVPAPALLGEGA